MTRESLPPLSAFRAHFDAGTWERGQRYAAQGRATVLELLPGEPSPGWWLLEADVVGSDPQPYEVTLSFSALSAGTVALESDCTCPVATGCKHSVAALAVALSGMWSDEGTEDAEAADAEPQPSEPAATQPPRRWPWALQSEAPVAAPSAPVAKEHELLERWLRARDLAGSARGSPRRPAGTARLVYVLTSELHEQRGPVVRLPGAGQAYWLCLWPARVRPLKNRPGQWGKPALLKNQYGRLFADTEGEGELFQMMRRWLLGQSAGTQGWTQAPGAPGGVPASAVQDPIGLQVLQAALQAGDVVTLDDAGNLAHVWHWGEPRDLAWTWREVPAAAGGQAACWQVCPDLGSDTCELRLGAPAFYIDHQTHAVGLVTTPQTTAQLADWLTLPLMPQDWMRARAPRLLALAPPLPSVVVGEWSRTVQGVPPVPHLRLAPAAEGQRALLSVHLSFDYDGVRGLWTADAPPEQWVEAPEGRVLLHRQVEAEGRWRAMLQAHGYDCPPPPALPSPWMADELRDRALLADDLRGLRDSGFVVSFDAALASQMREVTELDMGLAALDADGAVLDDDEATSARWFKLSLGFEVDGERVNLLPWLPQLLNHMTHGEPTGPDERLWLHADDGQWWHVPVAPLRPWLATMLELMGERQHHARRGEEFQLSRFEAMRLAAANGTSGALSLSGAQARSLGTMVEALKQGQALQEVVVPEGLHAELRPYQRQGLAWLQFLARHQLGGVLADDMGLGKTLQTIAHLWVEKQAGRLTRPALVVAPTSLMGNWRSELQRFAPGLRILVLHGAQRSGQFEAVPHSDVVITTYPLLSRDHETLLAQPWSIVVLDEAQTIKNARTQAASVVQSLDAGQRLCLSGTPMENHLGEIWSLFNFLMPGYLGSETRFRQLFRTPIEKHGDAERLKALRARLAPFMLRRSKSLVAAELPPKVETIEHVTLAPEQAKLYEAIRLTTEEKVREALSSKGLARSHITVLDALLKLRQVCCDPRLVPLAAAARVVESAKLDWLLQNLPEMIAEGRKVLLFSQFTSMLDLIEAELPALGLAWVKLTGQSTGREALIQRFTSGEVPLFLISLKAGGVGLNLPQADTVIHYDPWWNPAAEDQATDRAHRLGQTQTVFVHKLVAEGTLEERILALQARKAELARSLHGNAGVSGAILTEGDLDWLLQPLGTGLSDPVSLEAS